MSRRRKTTKKHTKKRRVSGIGSKKNSMLLMIGGIAAGYFLGPKLNDAITAKMPTVDPKLIAAGEVLVGFVIPKYALKNPAGKVLGGALIGAGLHEGLKAFGIIPDSTGLTTIHGYQDLRAIAGVNENNRGLSQIHVISGIEQNGMGADHSAYAY